MFDKYNEMYYSEIFYEDNTNNNFDNDESNDAYIGCPAYAEWQEEWN